MLMPQTSLLRHIVDALWTPKVTLISSILSDLLFLPASLETSRNYRARYCQHPASLSAISL